MIRNILYSVNYRNLALSRIKGKYQYLILGMSISLVLSSIIFNLMIRYNFISTKTNNIKVLPNQKIDNSRRSDDLWERAVKKYGSGFDVGDISTGASTSQVTFAGNKYVVKQGDSLSKIALEVYGDLYAWPRIAQANKITDPNQLEEGTTLIIPR